MGALAIVMPLVAIIIATAMILIAKGAITKDLLR